MQCLKVLVHAFVALSLLCAGCDRSERAAPDASAPGRSGLAAASSDPREVIMAMARQLAEAQGFSVTIHAAYDAVQPDGQKIEFGETRKITISRPDKLHVEVQQSDGVRRVVQFDGATLTVSGEAANVYAQAPLQGTVDQAVYHFLQDLQLRLPLAALMTTRLPTEFARRVQSVEFVETTLIHGAPAYHLAGRMEDVDFQVWVNAGERPLPQRIVLTYKREAGEPQYRAQFRDWNLSPRINDTLFKFTPADGAQRIAFLTQLPPPGSPPPAAAGEAE